jgi:carbon monoxide dehydrogenase subunit G
MAMDLRHEFTVPATIEETWAAFNDIESVAVCFPGATVSSVEGDTFTGSCKVKLGPIALVYNGTGTFVEKDESARRMVIDATGKDKRGNGTAGAHVVATMTAEGSSTRVEVVTDLNVTGKPAQFGRGVMQDVSDKLLGQFTACLEQKVGDSSAATAAASAEAAALESTLSPASSEPGVDGGDIRDLGAARAASAPAPDAAAAGAPVNPADVSTVTAQTPQSATASSPAGGEALDLGATVLPVLAKAYWKQAAGLVVALVLLRRVLRRG